MVSHLSHREGGEDILNEKISSEKRLALLRYNKQLLYRWIRRNQVGRPVDIFFRENNIKRVAFYYWNEMSELLYYELKNADILVTGIIDERTDLVIPLPVYTNVKEVPDVDVIVICTALNTAKIEEELRMHKKCLIITIDDLL